MHTADQQPGKGLANIPGDAGGALRDRHIETNAVAHRTLIRMLNGLKEFSRDRVFVPVNHDPALADFDRTETPEGAIRIGLAHGSVPGQSAAIVQGDPSGTITRAFPWRENRWIDDWRVRYMIQYPMVREWGTLDGEP